MMRHKPKRVDSAMKRLFRIQDSLSRVYNDIDVSADSIRATTTSHEDRTEARLARKQHREAMTRITAAERELVKALNILKPFSGKGLVAE